ncbi:hypothetical protein OJAV_G00012810 [Oryzias javanicus]|uniref:Ig-like domain-containing protein n=1 Tax=Oryzias javanicus TaxID=123683 RepID=A0A3S2MFY9_ORYJA|nr:hypothetical protein OJAV_G00012810 [Oryzias javanicus]
MSSTPFLLGVLFLACCLKDVYSGRCSLINTTGEFTIKDVKLEDGGSYTPEINNNIQPAITLRVYSPVPKPNITHDCKPEQTQCTLTCMFEKTDDMGDVQIFWIVDDRREKGGGALEITKETEEKTFICRLENSLSSENSNKLQNPLLTNDESEGTHIAVWIVLGLLAVLAVCVAVFLILRHKKHPIIMRFLNKQKQAKPEEGQQNVPLEDDTSANGAEGIQNTESVTTKTSTEETKPLLLENGKCNEESSVTVIAEINQQNDLNSKTRAEPEKNPDPAPSSETRSDPGGDAAPPEETKPLLLENGKCNEESSVTVTAEINHQNESDPQKADLEPATTPSTETTHEPNTKTDEEVEVLISDPSKEINHETGSGSSENDPPETDRAEPSSGSPDGNISTSEPS